ncbi:metallophosphoesterase family protein [Pokkaliibacter sp. CJK22405]|uniref:metallophosphoesterase family protein n=1 Tax=Pokkaliibacter sp. CJK22405 TaxID=3384615 RepID=UPI0039849728
MKFAVLSDIHSNSFALEAVIDDARKRGINRFVNLGDTLYGPIEPARTWQLLEALEDVQHIRGNQDRQIYEARPEEITANPTLAFILDILPQAAMDWLLRLPFDLRLEQALYLCHGSPSDDLIYLLENVENGSPRVRGDREILSLLDGRQEAMILCGHTHIPRIVYLSTGQRIINPGSVGLPAYSDDVPLPHVMENFAPLARYAVLEKRQDAAPATESWQAELISVSYDAESAAALAEQNGREDWAHALRTGRVRQRR